MTDYKATMVFEAEDASHAAQKVTRALYLGDLDVDQLKIAQLNDDGTVFDYPFTKALIDSLEVPDGV